MKAIYGEMVTSIHLTKSSFLRILSLLFLSLRECPEGIAGMPHPIPQIEALLEISGGYTQL